MLKKINVENETVAFIIHSGYRQDGIKFFTSDKDQMQLGAVYTETVLSNYASLSLQYKVQKPEVLGFFNEDWTSSEEKDKRDFITLAVNLFPLNAVQPEELGSLKEAIRNMYATEMQVELSENLSELLTQKITNLEELSGGASKINTVDDLLTSYFELDPTFYGPKMDSAKDFVQLNFMGGVPLDTSLEEGVPPSGV